jgi:hypothetical protein
LTPDQRALLYGEADHVRKYGRDYLNRLELAGFTIELYECPDKSLATQYRLDEKDPLIVARRPVEL